VCPLRERVGGESDGRCVLNSAWWWVGEGGNGDGVLPGWGRSLLGQGGMRFYMGRGGMGFCLWLGLGNGALPSQGGWDWADILFSCFHSSLPLHLRVYVAGLASRPHSFYDVGCALASAAAWVGNGFSKETGGEGILLQ